MAFKIYNTMARKKEELIPIDGEKVRMYTCGPTVYDYAHIGNFRAYMFEDLLRRYIQFSGYEVEQVQNITDVDDKTIRRSQERGIPLKEFTSTYTNSFFEDIKALNIEPAEHYPAATDYIDAMIAMIEKLIDLGYGYVAGDGSVYYRIERFEKYGALARLDLEGMQSGGRISQDEYEKDHIGDFALWKAHVEEDGDVAWDSPWGKGRPGWHIECSAMSTSILGESFDLHTGGIDNLFPHHEDEIAQSEAISGKTYSKYWMHCGHLIVDGKKMSKSLGNFYTLRDLFEKGYTGREIRYELLATQYRQPLNFTFDSLHANRSALHRLDDFYAKIVKMAASHTEENDLPDWALVGRKKFVEKMDDDMNIAGALAALFEIVHAGNRAMEAEELTSSQAASIRKLWHDVDRVLGLLIVEDEIPDEVLILANKRTEARANKQWDQSDQLREELEQLGWAIKDTADGYQLRRIG